MLLEILYCVHVILAYLKRWKYCVNTVLTYVPQLPLYGGLKEQIKLKLTSQGKFDLTNIIL